METKLFHPGGPGAEATRFAAHNGIAGDVPMPAAGSREVLSKPPATGRGCGNGIRPGDHPQRSPDRFLGLFDPDPQLLEVFAKARR